MCRYAVDSARPWYGIGPLGWARSYRDPCGESRNAARRGSGRTRRARAPGPARRRRRRRRRPAGACSRRTWPAAKGRTILAETVASGWGEGKAAAPMSDYKPQRFGASPPATLPTLADRSRAVRALGVRGARVARHRCRRHQPARSVAPVRHGRGRASARHRRVRKSRRSSKRRVTFDLSSLWAHDLAGRASSFQGDGHRRHGSRARGRTLRTNGNRHMTPLRKLAIELKLTTVSVAAHCRSRGIQTFRRLPDGANSGQMQAHLKNDDARQVRRHYSDRLADRSG